MKTFFVLIALSFSISLSAQVHPHALGLRSGYGNFGFGGELSYQMGIGNSNRLELDLGWRGNNGWGNNNSLLVFSGIYHWNWNLVEGLNWYIGPGAQLGYWQFKNKDEQDAGLFIGVGGQIGLEYDFSVHGVPLLLAIDTRPMWGSAGYGVGYGGALSLRYIFE